MSDTISRKWLIEAVEEAVEEGWIRLDTQEDHNRIIHLVRDMAPSAQPERKTGRWIERDSGIEDKENGFETVIVCSCCDFPATTFYSSDCKSRTQIRTDFCPNCGADMRDDKK